jgi:hypothetical protein
MAPLTAAVALGMVAGIAVPWAAAGRTDVLGGLLAGEPMRVPLGAAGTVFHWSWPIFCLVTLLAWGLLRAAGSR